MSKKSVIEWIRQHDESWLFVLSYITLAVVLSVFISLFWLVVVVLVHFLFEVIRQSARFQTRGRIFWEALWEVKLDIALVLSAFVLALYMEALLGILGLRSASQAGVAASQSARLGARIGGWERAIRGILISVDDGAHAVRPLMRRMNGRRNGGNGDEEKEDPGEEAKKSRHGHDSTPFLYSSWTKGDYFTLSLLALMVVLMGLAPSLTEHTLLDSIHIVLEELHPFPPGGPMEIDPTQGS